MSHRLGKKGTQLNIYMKGWPGLLAKCCTLLILLLSVGCAQTPVSETSKTYVIEEADPDIKMNIDDQFLKKSQKFSREDTTSKGQRRKKYFQP